MTDNILTCTTVDEFTEWMEKHHEEADEVWVALPKKGTDVPSITRNEALDVALCYGWIDGKAFSGNVPDGWWAQRFSPRRRRSPWSKINVAKAEALIEAGRMSPAGFRQIELAKADGRWEAAYAPQSTAEVTPDLQEALDASPAAAEAFGKLSRSNRYQILLNLQKAVKPETRARRIVTYVERLANGEPPHGPRRR
ncbi:YdeI family protein [Streptomyces sp. ST2-7A]|uniref:YdeI/OmpD-associated family protein n=1 Tax=Streptomyces sp. ST2-7A TaxID=2907214 RepID=UPI001F30D94E|nr:YdeI/OmpD-associated family protein [Streptomyces sp. ST2-7A]MCE7082339.1 YdeI/OmpD-associated family protein [Streptomyces sp. ST2-7A]